MKSLLVISSFILLVLAVSLPVNTFAAADCAGAVASIPTDFTATAGPQKGEITLKWNLSTNIRRYDLNYGYWPSKFQFGVLRAGNSASNSFKVGNLGSGVKYYFQMNTYCGALMPNKTKVISGVAL